MTAAEEFGETDWLWIVKALDAAAARAFLRKDDRELTEYQYLGRKARRIVAALEAARRGESE